jgi:uncharacterized glyoxalase superfamily protein PhnB
MPSFKPMIVPCLRYRDAPAMIDWLEKVFGFTRQLVVPGPDNLILHAQLVLGDGMVMVGSVKESEYDQLMIHPSETDRRQTQAPYVVVADADEVFGRALAAGAASVMPVTDQDYSGRLGAFRDPEGYLWNVGTYDPRVPSTGG